MKKVPVALIAAVIAAIGTCSSALTFNQDFVFTLTAGGASDYSYSTEKADGENRWYCTPKSFQNGIYSTWTNGNKVRFRARFDNGRTPASGLCTKEYPTFTYPYSSGCARAGEMYRLYADVSSGSSSCKVVGTWCP